MRDRILREATHLFAQKGFEATSLAEIAAAVEIKKPSLLYHFKNKAALRVAVLAGMLDHFRGVLPQLLAAAAGEEKLEPVLRALLGFFDADRDRARLLLRETLDRPDEMRELIRDHVAPWVRRVEARIQQGQAMGHVHGHADPAAYCVHAIQLVVGGMAAAESLGVLLDEEPEAAEQRLVEELLRMLHRGLYRATPGSEFPKPLSEAALSPRD